MLDISHFKEEDATELEKAVYSVFQQQQEKVFQQIKEELTKETPVAYKDLSKEMQEYQSYIVNEFLTRKKEILSMDAIDAADPTYIAWSKDESISLKEFLTYAAGKTGLIFHSFQQKVIIWILLRYIRLLPIISPILLLMIQDFPKSFINTCFIRI